MNTKFETKKNSNETQNKLDLRPVEFTSHTDLVELEHEVLKFWEELDLVSMVKAKNSGKRKFSFYDGPVTANNPLGVHHAWGRTLKDVVQRYKSLKGFDQRFEYGFDTQGLWVEVEVEKALGFNSKQELEDFGVDNFVEACKSRVNKFSTVQDNQSTRLGMLKAKNSYYTHSDTNISAIWQFLRQCHDNKWLYKGVRPMPWCPRCGTSLSSHEQADAYKEVTHTSLYVKFKVNNLENTYFVVWTTTPWTLPANLAVAVHPDKQYGYFSNGSETLVTGLWLKDTLMSEYTVEKTVKGTDLLNLSYATAFSHLPKQYLQDYKVVPWAEVSEEEGTGVVHLAPGCGQEDYNLLKEELEPLSPLNEDGTYGSDYGKFSNLHYKEVNLLVEQQLKESNLLVKSESYNHRYPHCWRCKTELVYRLVDEWFLKMDEVRDKLVKAADEVEWDPTYTKKLFLDWVRNMGDWCVSRKRYWGLPLPFYECSCGHLTVVSSKEEFLENAVGDVSQVQELHLPWVDTVQYPCESCGQPVDRVTEVGDCWLDAGVMPFSTLNYFTEDKSHWEEWFPADFVCEMREQVRLWFYSLMVLGVTFVGKAPFKTLLSYEKVKDKNNQEMHKSGKNNVVLDDALEGLGADTLRLYYLTQSRSSNMRFDFEVGENLFRLSRRLLNSFKFFQTYADLEEFTFDPNFVTENVHDRWILSRLDTYLDKFCQHMDEYDFQLAVETLSNSVEDLSSWYLRRVRERVWNKESQNDRSVYSTLFVVFKQLSVMFAPVTPFMSEMVYQNLRSYNQKMELSVHLETYTQLGTKDTDLEKAMRHIMEFDDMSRQLRNELSLKMRQPLAKAYVWDPEFLELPDTLHQTLTELLNVKQVEVLKDPAEFVNFQLKPNFALLGPKYGQKVNQVEKLLNNLDQQSKAEFGHNEAATLTVGEYVLHREEVEIHLTPVEGLEMTTSGNAMLLLDTKLSDKLKLEGWVRDFSRQVQVRRKELQLPVEARVNLHVSGSDNLLEFLNNQFQTLKDQLYLSELVPADNLEGNSFEHDLGTVVFKLTD